MKNRLKAAISAEEGSDLRKQLRIWLENEFDLRGFSVIDVQNLKLDPDLSRRLRAVGVCFTLDDLETEVALYLDKMQSGKLPKYDLLERLLENYCEIYEQLLEKSWQDDNRNIKKHIEKLVEEQLERHKDESIFQEEEQRIVGKLKESSMQERIALAEEERKEWRYSKAKMQELTKPSLTDKRRNGFDKEVAKALQQRLASDTHSDDNQLIRYHNKQLGRILVSAYSGYNPLEHGKLPTPMSGFGQEFITYMTRHFSPYLFERYNSGDLLKEHNKLHTYIKDKSDLYAQQQGKIIPDLRQAALDAINAVLQEWRSDDHLKNHPEIITSLHHWGERSFVGFLEQMELGKVGIDRKELQLTVAQQLINDFRDGNLESSLAEEVKGQAQKTITKIQDKDPATTTADMDDELQLSARLFNAWKDNVLEDGPKAKLQEYMEAHFQARITALKKHHPSYLREQLGVLTQEVQNLRSFIEKQSTSLAVRPRRSNSYTKEIGLFAMHESSLGEQPTKPAKPAKPAPTPTTK